MYKVFVNDKPVVLTDDINRLEKDHHGIHLTFDTREVLLLGIEALEDQENVDSLVVVHDDLAHLWEVFRSNYTLIVAAGGLVKNTKGEILFIKRFGKWDLPKGKIDKGEDAKEAAVREVEEECGISGLSIVGELSPTYHIYLPDRKAGLQDDKKVLKKTHWFEMSYNGDEPLKPQTEEGITEVRWLNESDMKMVLDNTYNSIRELLIG